MSNNHYKQELSHLVEHLEPEVLKMCISTIPEDKNQDYYKGMYDAFQLLSQHLSNGVSNTVLPQLIMSSLVASQRHIDD